MVMIEVLILPLNFKGALIILIATDMSMLCYLCVLNVARTGAQTWEKHLGIITVSFHFNYNFCKVFNVGFPMYFIARQEN
jgi:hypothetical protein